MVPQLYFKNIGIALAIFQISNMEVDFSDNLHIFIR